MKIISTKKLSSLVIDKRKQLNLTQEDLSINTEIEINLIHLIEKGKYIPNINQMERLIAVLEIEFTSIIMDYDEDKIIICI